MDIFDVVETTWPAAATHVAGPWKIRDGQGGGKRVSSVEWITDHFDADDLDQAEDAMRALGQDALFMIRPEHGVLDAALAARGYEIIDPVNIYQARATDIATERPPRGSGRSVTFFHSSNLTTSRPVRSTHLIVGHPHVLRLAPSCDPRKHLDPRRDWTQTMGRDGPRNWPQDHDCGALG